MSGVLLSEETYTSMPGPTSFSPQLGSQVAAASPWHDPGIIINHEMPGADIPSSQSPEVQSEVPTIYDANPTPQASSHQQSNPKRTRNKTGEYQRAKDLRQQRKEQAERVPGLEEKIVELETKIVTFSESAVDARERAVQHG